MSTTKNKNKSAKASKSIKDASVSPATTKDKDKALQAVIGMWADREDLQDVKEFRRKLWRKTN